ncbi:MAG TPA: hypothetical protein VMF50_05195, partial [Candidatus Binataceae bacterium]|nr:hypothetical protein [Candidatus Binataceae bacterium]
DPIVDDSFYLMFNAHHKPLGFILPSERWGKKWRLVLDTYAAASRPSGNLYRADEAVRVEGRSLIMLRQLD